MKKVYGNRFLVYIAEQFNTTPWDVRKNITYWDIDRITAMNSARNKSQKQHEAFNKAKELARDSIR